MKKILITVLGLAVSLIASAQQYVSQRPAEKDRLFTSEIVEAKIQEITSKLVNPKLAWMFANCYPNTLDTTVHHNPNANGGLGDTFVYTGDIEAMWLRDSAAQVWPYVSFAASDEKVRKMIAGTIISNSTAL